MIINVAARSSALSKAQVKEVQLLLLGQGDAIEFRTFFVESTGDLDQRTSLRALGKTDFFTKEVDELLLTERCRIAIHSAKDLPDPLPAGLQIVALTQGLDPSDALVLRDNVTIDSLSSGAVIATSSERREAAIKILRNDLKFIDLRGTIHQRLDKLHSGAADGVVIAEAALIRLGLTHLNRVRLPGETTPLQGQLAIVARAGDAEMRQLFAKLDCRPSLCLGIDIPKRFQNRMIHHHPIIQISPRANTHADIKEAFLQLKNFTHIIFTSKVGVKLFFQQLASFGYDISSLANKRLVAVGAETAQVIREYDANVHLISKDEHAEGLVSVLQDKLGAEDFVLWPHSSISRQVLPDFFQRNKVRYVECILYDTGRNEKHEARDLSSYGEIIFTSPSTVDAFLEIYGCLPNNIWLTPIGPVTEKHLITEVHREG